MSDNELLGILRHALGVTEGGASYRNRYCADAIPALDLGVEKGWLTGPHHCKGLVAPLWYVTADGMRVVGVDPSNPESGQ